MKNFLGGEWRKQTAKKRGGDVEILSLDFGAAERRYVAEPSHLATPEALYERRWALDMLERAAAEVRSHYEKNGRADLFDALKPFLGADGAAVPYSELADQLGQSEGALRTALSRLRSRWRQQLRALVRETVAEETDTVGELEELAGAIRLTS